ncbi:histidinol dehydrogenase [Pullulanibacillus sp. KACC 23026]|uniref:histidinol dehydrogenase n=1 Tax=Pullulanibacillus sp. KACC 23026 TaxID=3028315 RepID=UPI0023AEB5B2|nr:histidinol dehydrogenase [Pullulanibacillus sp. KACC 23026]WEG13616.1 histidinol dehydrogenase [Pullulanibacillus sp. KACC 23026]
MEWRSSQDLDFLNDRNTAATKEAEASVKRILQLVQEKGEEGILELTEQFDKVRLTRLRVTDTDIQEAYKRVDDVVIEAIRKAAKNIESFHDKQKVTSWFEEAPDGTMLGQKVTPLDSIGLYVPGGSAAYPSSVLMGAIPAKVAGVKRIVLVSPPQADGKINPGVLVAANEVGVTECYSVGGAQAIGALAYGTETIQPVDKIVGPGNLYVTLAKKEVFGSVAIDSLAGPSEIVILADRTANPAWIASDLLSQAEHDPHAMAVLITNDRELGEKVDAEVQKQCAALPRKSIAGQSISSYGKLFLVDTIEAGIEVVNRLAPEHLEVVTENPESWLPHIRHAGAIFLGAYSSEPVGDYLAGPNHIIPTNGTARFGSPLNVESFIKRSSIIRYSEKAFKRDAEAIMTLARYEGLEGHAQAIEQRLQGGLSNGANRNDQKNNSRDGHYTMH